MKKWIEVSPYTGIEEDAPTNAVGGGSVAGLGVGPMGEPGVHRRKKKKKETLIDGRTKAYRQHRERLEKSRLKRQEAQNYCFRRRSVYKVRCQQRRRRAHIHWRWPSLIY